MNRTNTLKKSLIWPKIVLFGDSHTQRSFDPNNGCWGSLLANRFQRICDVIPRGFSGYNTKWCRIIMPKIFEQFDRNEIICVTILLGSNDSVPNTSATGQHVSIEDYRNNIMAMINYLNNEIGIEKDRIILITPPNMDQESFKKWSIEQNRPIIPDTWEMDIIDYVNVCRTMAKEMNLSLLDLYDVFVKHDDNRKLFNDGLHLSRLGGQLFYDNLLPLVIERVESFFGQKFNDQLMRYPYWRNIKDDEKDLLSINY